ncbi:chitin deacetylase [Mucor ambiguus]|uniref:Chitin deacetylase n=1 Tax=Mucor ambiguus TaxID=91626 RepID=A0A0C9M445_9FUNG|nr:chitin deacetylase [Mucor ambiguus]
MFHKLFILATVALTVVNAHPGSHAIVNAAATPQTIKLKETYPPAFKIPTAKPEWLELIKNINITKAPVYKNLNNAGPQPEVAGQDPYCDWTFTGCFGKEDLYQCPKGQWALTYDDGPSEFSPKLYDYLDKVNVKATFFMVGGQVVQYPDYALRAYKSGHELAMHTWSHNYMTTLTNEQIVAELKWNELVIKEVTGVAPRYFRPPYGDIDNRVRDVAAALGFAPIIWNHDTNDWAYASNPKVFKESWIDGNVTKWANAAKSATVGGISLEHDLYTQTVDAAIRILPILQKEYELVPAGKCNNVPVYKGNATVPTAASSSVPPATSTTAAKTTTTPPAVVAATTAAPSSSTTPIAANVVGSGASFTGASAVGLGVAVVAAMALI